MDQEKMIDEGMFAKAKLHINHLASVIGEITRLKGFHEDWMLARWLEDLAERTTDQTDAERLKQVAESLRINVIGTKLMLIVSELSEALESLRDTGYRDIRVRGNFVEELADAEIRIKDLSSMIKVDLGKAETEKIRKNASRPYKHGRVV